MNTKNHLIKDTGYNKCLNGKLMQLDRPPSKIRSKSYLNWLLIDFFDPNLPVRSIVTTISIQIQTQKVQIRAKMSILGVVFNINGRFQCKWLFLIKYEDFRLNQYISID